MTRNQATNIKTSCHAFAFVFLTLSLPSFAAALDPYVEAVMN